VFFALTFNQPVKFAVVPGTNRRAVVEVGGKIYTFVSNPDLGPKA
jgi:hypothetical protein